MGFFDLTGQTAVVTGAAAGIGEAIALRLAAACGPPAARWRNTATRSCSCEVALDRPPLQTNLIELS